MLASLVLKGLAIGLSISAPVGPVGILCIRRSFVSGRSFGLATGLGAATADVIFSLVIGFGLNAIAKILIREGHLLGLIGGVLFCSLGVGICFSTPAVDSPTVPVEASLLSAFASALFLTIINPMSLLSLVAIFSALGVGIATDWLEIVGLVFGIGLGAMLWWFVLTSASILLRGKISVAWMRAISWLAGLAILGVGVQFIVSSLGMMTK